MKKIKREYPGGIKLVVEYTEGCDKRLAKAFVDLYKKRNERKAG